MESIRLESDSREKVNTMLTEKSSEYNITKANLVHINFGQVTNEKGYTSYYVDIVWEV